ncbi:BC1881 family protein [Clostridium gasigenes]|uniref:BC1881 family protein n=1 Tax=Clostridium gasigenes TaxID=94869 RepID=UPI0016255B8A|nr:BC1881 family protein [Clostridium gasigenes]
MDLKGISTKALIDELKSREGSRSMEINKSESFKVLANGNDGSKSRYIRGYGPVIVLEIMI